MAVFGDGHVQMLRDSTKRIGSARPQHRDWRETFNLE